MLGLRSWATKTRSQLKMRDNAQYQELVRKLTRLAGSILVIVFAVSCDFKPSPSEPVVAGKIVAFTNGIGSLEAEIKKTSDCRWAMGGSTNDVPNIHVLCKIRNIGKQLVICPEVAANGLTHAPEEWQMRDLHPG